MGVGGGGWKLKQYGEEIRKVGGFSWGAFGELLNPWCLGMDVLMTPTNYGKIRLRLKESGGRSGGRVLMLRSCAPWTS